MSTVHATALSLGRPVARSLGAPPTTDSSFGWGLLTGMAITFLLVRSYRRYREDMN